MNRELAKGKADTAHTCRSSGRAFVALSLLLLLGLLSAVGDARGSTTTSAVTASTAFDSVSGSGGGAGNYVHNQIASDNRR